MIDMCKGLAECLVCKLAVFSFSIVKTACVLREEIVFCSTAYYKVNSTDSGVFSSNLSTTYMLLNLGKPL